MTNATETAIAASAREIAAILVRRRQRVAVAESSSGGLISAALLAVPGASAFYLGGAVLYTRRAVKVMMDFAPNALTDIRSASEPYAGLVATRMRERFDSDWAIAETGAAGPDGNPYGDAPGHCCIAVAGPVAHVTTLETGIADRAANMSLFAAGALELFLEALRAN